MVILMMPYFSITASSQLFQENWFTICIYFQPHHIRYFYDKLCLTPCLIFDHSIFILYILQYILEWHIFFLWVVVRCSEKIDLQHIYFQSYLIRYQRQIFCYTSILYFIFHQRSETWILSFFTTPTYKKINSFWKVFEQLWRWDFWVFIAYYLTDLTKEWSLSQ